MLLPQRFWTKDHLQLLFGKSQKITSDFIDHVVGANVSFPCELLKILKQKYFKVAHCTLSKHINLEVEISYI